MQFLPKFPIFLPLLWVGVLLPSISSGQCTVYFPAPDTTGWLIPSVVDDCDNTLIRTDPYDPFNTNNWQRTNTFNWIDPNPEPQSSWEEYCLNSNTIPSSYVKTPFSQDDNALISHFLRSQDKYPQDGWELIKQDFGYTAAGYPGASPVDYPYLILYNRFTGIMRVFVALSETNIPNQVALFELGFISSPMSSNLDISTAFTANHSGITALKSFEKTPAFFAVSRYLDGPGRWFYADFPMMYDPCVCAYGSSIRISVTLIKTQDITLGSAAEGLLIPDDNDIIRQMSGLASNPATMLLTLGRKNIGGADEKAVQKSVQTYKSMPDFRTRIEEVIDQSGISTEYKQVQKQAVTQLVSALELPAAFKSGLLLSGHVSSALAQLDFFVGGGRMSSGSQEMIVQPIAMVRDTRYKGAISDKPSSKDIIIAMPGSANNSLNNTHYPAYNEALGVIHLVEEPILKKNPALDPFLTDIPASEVVDPFSHNAFYVHRPGHREAYVSYVPYRYQMPDAPPFIVNPATEFTDQSEIMGAFFVVAKQGNQAAGVGYRQGDHFNLISEGKGIYRTAYVPLSCMAGMTLDFAADVSTDIEVYLSVIANFERGDAYATASTQNVLWHGNFSVRLVSEPGFNESSPFRGVGQNLVFNQSAVLAGDITVYETVTVKTGVELSSPAPVTIRAGSAFVIEPGAVVSPNINFEIATPNGCTDGYQPTPISALTAYCVSQAYNSADRQVQSLPDQDDPQPPFEEKKPIPFTAAPNPFTGEITLRFSLPEADRVSLTVLDLTGRTVATIWQDRTQEAGEVKVPWIGSELAPGIYIAVLETRRGRETVRIVKQ